jgi:N-glycosylase/DNA lyase
MGFRAPYLLATARIVAQRETCLEEIGNLPLEEARTALMAFPGVGPKIANCVLLFAYGHPRAFPLDVWIMKALRKLYFPGKRVSLKRLRQFADVHFGPNSGYAQQYLFHYARIRKGLLP